MNSISQPLANIAIAIILIFFTLVIGMIQNEKKHFITEKGLDCVTLNLFTSPSCNWEQYNALTNYGQEPAALKEYPDIN